MGFSVLPTNIGGVSLNSIAGPLASLMGGSSSMKNMLFPADLGSNPSMGHAVIFTVYDYKTGLTAETNTLVENAGKLGKAAFDAFSPGATEATKGAYNKLSGAGGSLIGSGWNVALAGVSAANYTPLTKGTNLATISLFMPETMQINYNSTYGEVELTQELGLPGIISNAISDNPNGLSSASTPYAKAIGAAILQDLATKVGLGSNLGALAKQSMNIFTNPQLQLLYKGISLREFSLSFTLTPKTKAEAETVKNICDSFAYYSLPGISGAQDGNSGMFLTPPQVFQVDFQFLGDSGLVGKASNAIYSALNKTGLNVLAGNSTTVTNGKPSKTFTVNDCVLQGVSIDYAPNGWATYNDGYPVQTTILLNFKETTMYTKREFKNSAVASNYSQTQANQQMSDFNTGAPMGGGNSSSIDLNSPAYGPDGG